MRSGRSGKAFFLHRSGAPLLPHALLKAFGEVIDLFISKMTDMTDPERCLLDLSLSFADLDSELGIKPLNQTFDIETRAEE